MKQLFYFKSLLIALFVLIGGGSISAAVETINFSEKGYTNGTSVTTVEGTGITITFNKGTSSNAPKYYDTGYAVRVYGGGYFTVTAKGNNITQIDLVFSSGEGNNTITTDVGTYSNKTWTGLNESVTFTVGGNSGHRRIKSITVTYRSEQQQEKTTPTLTFSQEIVNLFVGDEYTPSLTKPTGVEVSYSIEDETIATLYDTGHLKALKAGTTTITATSVENELYLSASVSFTLNVVEGLSAEGTYELVTDASTLKNGDQILITYITSTQGYVLGEQKTNNFGIAQLKSKGLSEDRKSFTVTDEENVTAAVLEGSAGAWYFHTNYGYLCAAGSNNSNYLKTTQTINDNAKATISIDNGNAAIVFQGSYSNKYLKYNSQSTLFSCYGSSSSQTPVQLYRKVPSNVPPTVTFSPASGTEVDYGTQVTITARTATSIIYSVNDGEAVTVEGTSAAVTINTHSTIKATAINEFGTSEEVTAVYTINQESSALSYNPTEYTITIGDDFTAPEVNKPDDYNGTITYASDNDAVAEVNSTTGEITIKAAGEANITASGTETEHYAAATASYKITVNKQASAVSFAETVVEITYGDNYDKQKATAEGFSGDLVYSSSDKSVVKFHGNGVIDVLGPGTVTITATAPATETTEESSATYTLKIYEPSDAVKGQTELLNEKFDDCKGSEPKDGFGGNSSGFTNVPASLAEAGWELTRCQAGDGYLKLTSGSGEGTVTTPSIALNGTTTLSFDVAPWKNETATIEVSLENATFEDGVTTSKTFNDLEQNTWKTKTFDIIGNGNVKISITSKNWRSFIDNFVVGGGAQPAHEINLTFSSAGYLTWVATADIDFTQTTGVTAYKITEATPKKITMVEVDKVKAGEAVMLKGSGTVQLTRTTGAEAFTDNKMQPCTDGSVTGNGVGGVTNTDVYVLGNGKNGLGFYMLKGTLQAGKGYLRVTEEAGNAKQNFIAFEETTGVNTVRVNDDSDAAVYNLQGIRVVNPQKGVYVKNGRKFIVK